jgi:hypothetical protein
MILEKINYIDIGKDQLLVVENKENTGKIKINYLILKKIYWKRLIILCWKRLIILYWTKLIIDSVK